MGDDPQPGTWRSGRPAGEGVARARGPRPRHRARRGHGGTGRSAKSSPRKWLTQRLRSALGMLQMVTHRCLMDRGCPDGSLEPASSLSYLTPFSKIFATCGGSHTNLLNGAARRGRHTEARMSPRRESESETRARAGAAEVRLPGRGQRNAERRPERQGPRQAISSGTWRSWEQSPVSGVPPPWPQGGRSMPRSAREHLVGRETHLKYKKYGSVQIQTVQKSLLFRNSGG